MRRGSKVLCGDGTGMHREKRTFGIANLCTFTPWNIFLVTQLLQKLRSTYTSIQSFCHETLLLNLVDGYRHFKGTSCLHVHNQSHFPLKTVCRCLQTLIFTCKSSWCHCPEDNFNSHHCENLACKTEQVGIATLER